MANISVTGNYTNCTSDSKGSIDTTEITNLEIIANDGFVFTQDTPITVTGMNGSSFPPDKSYNPVDNPTFFTENNTVFSQKWSRIIGIGTTKATVTATAKQDAPPPDEKATWSQTVNQCKTNVGDTTVPKGFTLIVTAQSGYEFTKDRYVTLTYNDGTTGKDFIYDPVNKPTYFSQNNTVCTIPLSENWNNTKAINLLANTSIIVEPKEPITYNDKLTHVTSNLINNVKYDPSKTVVLTAEEGHSFQTDIMVTYRRTYHPSKRITFYPTDPKDAKYFNEDKTVFTHVIEDVNIPDPNDPMDYWDCFSVEYVATAKEIYDGDDNDVIDGLTTPFANVYSASDGVLSALANDRWLVTGSDYIDMGEYLYNVYKYPLAIDPALISTDQIKIKLGRYETKTSSNYFLRTRVKFDLGKIKVDEEYHNVYDYRNVTCLIHVPYSDPIQIDSTYVIGQELQLYYMLDLYNGTTTLEVYSTKIANELVFRQPIEVAYDIPFMKQSYNDVKGRLGKYLSNRINIAYIEVIRPIPYDTMSEQGKEGKEVKMLSEFKGYVEVKDVHLDTKATDVEQDHIRQLLRSGVYIN